MDNVEVDQVNCELNTKTFVAGMVSTLDKAGVPSLLWDTLLLSLYGVPTVILVCGQLGPMVGVILTGTQDHCLIVSDDQAQIAYEALKSETLHPCNLGRECWVSDFAWSKPPPERHLHWTREDIVKLYTMSQLFHPDHFPNMGPDSSDLMLASSPSFLVFTGHHGCGPYPDHLHPVRVPTPVFYTEAILRLAARDVDEANLHNCHWTTAWSYIAQYVDKVSPALFKPEDLKPEFKRVWDAFGGKRQPGERFVTILRRLKAELAPWKPLQSIGMPTEMYHQIDQSEIIMVEVEPVRHDEEQGAAGG